MALRASNLGAHPPRTLEECKHTIQSIPMHIWGGGDGGFSIKLDENRSVWFYGDSYTEPLTGGYTFWHSTAHILTDGRFRVCNQGDQILPNDVDGVYYWPSGGVKVAENRILVAGVGIKNYPDGSWAGVSYKAAYLDVSSEGDLVFDRWLDYWPTINSLNSISWGHPYLDGETLVVFGWGSSEASTGRRLFVSSVPLADVEDHAAWSIGSTPLRSENESGGNCSVRKDGATWRVLTHEYFFSTNIYVYEATSLAGPWSRRVLLQAPVIYKTMLYGPHWHPEIKLRNGKALITMSRQTTEDQNEIYNNRLLCLEAEL